MALIKCGECGKEISDKAVACPFCGNPNRDNLVAVGMPVEIEKTSKKWKKRSLWSLLWVFVGFCTLSISVGFGVLVIIIGMGIGLSAAIGSWWTNG
jgi:hypothetical protein